MKPVAPVTSTVCRAGSFSTRLVGGRAGHARQPPCRGEIAQAAQRRADRGGRGNDAEQPGIGRLDPGRLHRPAISTGSSSTRMAP